MNRKIAIKSRPAAIALGTVLALSASAWATPEPEPKSESPIEANGAAPEMQMPTETDMGAMDHARMQMQGGEAPEDARDPHAYSGGYQLDGGPYALAPEDRLRLADEHQFGSFMVNRLEYLDKEAAVSYDILAWYGTSYDKFTLLAEGDYGAGRLRQSQTELLWSHALATFWDSRLGVRLDQHLAGSSRQWLAMGVQGLAPYWFELALMGYLGDGGATALVLEAEYELLLTQKLILQPMAELTFYGKQDEINDLGSGLSSAAMGVRLRYEISRQFAPYLGVEWTAAFGGTADYAALQGQERQETSLLAGLRFWF